VPIKIDYTSRVRGIFNSVTVSQGYGYAGPRYGTINREVFKTFSTAGTNYSISELSNNVTFGTRTSLDSQDNTLLFCSTELGRFIKTKLTMPAEIKIILPLNQFDNTVVKFDQTLDTDGNPITFDDTTP
jgi:Leucine-rich repeat (LRR) protein